LNTYLYYYTHYPDLVQIIICTIVNMEKENIVSGFIDEKILNDIKKIEREKEEELLQIIVEILVTSTLKEYHEESH
jgi:hypothetical protein